MTSRITRYLAPGLVAAAAFLFSVPSQAATVQYDLVRQGALTNVDDASGRWQFDGGNFYLNGVHYGYYIRKKRVAFGVPTSVNKAAVETTLIWKYGSHALTVQGTHFFGNGAQVGGVSAASAGWSFLSDATVSGTHTALTFTY